MKQSGFRLFLLIWIGSLISEIGSGMTSFALGVYIFQLTGLYLPADRFGFCFFFCYALCFSTRSFGYSSGWNSGRSL